MKVPDNTPECVRAEEKERIIVSPFPNVTVNRNHYTHEEWEQINGMFPQSRFVRNMTGLHVIEREPNAAEQPKKSRLYRLVEWWFTL